MRVTDKDLQGLLDQINEANGFDPKNTTFRSVGAYELCYAYGGVELHKIVNDGGGIRVASPNGYGTKREMFNYLRGILAGLQMK